ncbi:hypothetical protein [Proteus mirabilis]|uniref:hypothetical protein n=1 Tax=Proteus mirabilis TaxID=584 RepID=UPI0034D7A31E
MIITLVIGTIISILMVAFFRKKVNEYDRSNYTLHSSFASMAILVAVMTVLNIADKSSIMDSEILNGVVISKENQTTSCEHQYVCGQVCSTSNNVTSCTPIYCHEHAYDIDWVVKTSVGNIKIDRVDRQGVRTPKRFNDVVIGEPASLTHSTKNYFKGDEFNWSTSEEIKNKFSEINVDYPTIFDYYKVNTVINTTSIDLNIDEINSYLRNRLKTMGHEKQVNVVIVITDSNDHDFAEYVLDKWKGGKKNDVILFYGIDQDLEINWFKSNTFANGEGNKFLIETLRTNTYHDKFGLTHVIKQMDSINEHFTRLSNEDLEYMYESRDKASVWWHLLSLIFIFTANLIVLLKLKD